MTTIIGPLANKVLLISASAILAGATAVAQMPPGGGSQPPAGQQMPTPMPNAPGGDNTATTAQQFSDQAFVRKALEGGDAEVQLGQLAEQKSQSADVKQFAAKMVSDHGQLGDKMMKPIARKLGVDEPKGPSKKDKQLMAKLESLSGPQFDEEYIKAMVKDHRQDLKDFQDEAKMAADPNLQQAAQVGSKMISQHLQLIEQIAQSHNVTADNEK